jgi:hypothetical protein
LETTINKSEVLSSGLVMEPVKGKRRERACYYRRITVIGGEMIWVRTGLLPSDAVGREYYLTKGFRLSPPEGWDTGQQAVIAPVSDEKDTVIQSLLNKITELNERLDKSKENVPPAVSAKPGKGKGKTEV